MKMKKKMRPDKTIMTIFDHFDKKILLAKINKYNSVTTYNKTFYISIHAVRPD